jgi:DNA repair exonuclease SbcCD nuclease subunit
MAVTKIIACSDIHIPSLKGIDELKDTLSVFIDKCKKVVKEEDGPENVRIVVAGDIFHNKLAITNESILCANWFFSELDKICKTFIVIGNHDFLMNNTGRVDSLSPLFEIGSYNQVYFLDKELDYKSGIYVDDNVAWCLYSSFTGFNTPDINVHKESMKGLDNAPEIYVGVIHGDVNGAITTTNRVTENGLDPGIFDGCDFVIAGHIHKRQEIKKNGVRIVYCSSIRQRDMGESINGHGFVVWDTEDPEDIEYKYVDIPNPDGGFYKFVVNDISDIQDDKEELLNY